MYVMVMKTNIAIVVEMVSHILINNVLQFNNVFTGRSEQNGPTHDIGNRQ